MNVQAKPLSAITRHAIDLLSKGMGIVDTVWFLNQFTTGYGDYTEERDALFKDLTRDEILTAMKCKTQDSICRTMSERVGVSPGGRSLSF